MQRSTALLDLFCTGDLCTTKTSAYLNLDPLSTHTQCRSDRHFDSSFIINTVLDLAGNSVSYDHCIQFRTTYLKDIDLNIIFTSQLFQFFFNPVHFSTTFTNDDTRLRGMNSNDKFT